MKAVTLDEARVALRRLRALLDGVPDLEPRLDFRAGGYGVKVVVTRVPTDAAIPAVVEGVEVRIERR